MDKGELKSVYRHLVLKNHPDKGGSDEEMRWINAAYDVLKDSPVASSVSQTDPSDLFYGRTMPKKNKTKVMLEPVHATFKDEYNDAVLGQGWYDFLDLVQMVRYIEKHGVEVSYDPLFPIDPKTGKWLTKDLMIYCNFWKLNPFNKQSAQLMIQKVAKRYSTTPKKSA